MDTVQQNVILFHTVMTNVLCMCLYESLQNDYHYLTNTVFHKIVITLMVFIGYFLFKLFFLSDL